MAFSREIPQDTRLVLGLTESGQGKTTGAVTLLEHLGNDVSVTTPSQGLWPTRLAWQRANGYYMQGAQGPAQAAYESMRAHGVSPWKLRVANGELLHALRRRGAHLVSMHGAFGYEAEERTFVEIDRSPERLAATTGTHALVPLPETRDDLWKIGKEKGVVQEIEVVGFLVPEALKDPSRRERRIETLSQTEPTKENPLRLAFMTTGQFGHQDMLAREFFGDELVRKWIKEGRMNLDIYMWNSKDYALQSAEVATGFGMHPVVTDSYDPTSEHGVQIFYNNDPFVAVNGSIAMAGAADVVASPIAERVGWTLTKPFIALPPVGRNPKMISNATWAGQELLTAPLERGQRLEYLLPEFFGNGRYGIERFHDESGRVEAEFDYGDLTGGAAQVAKIVYKKVGASR